MRFTHLTTLIAILLAGCGDDRPPAPPAAPVSATIPASADALFTASARELIAEGFTIASQDRQLGIISTAPKVTTLTATDAVCPGSMGINLVTEPRTVIHLSWSVTVADQQATVRPTIEYSYLDSDPAWGRHGEGQSLGTLEPALLAKIRAAVPGEPAKAAQP